MGTVRFTIESHDYKFSQHGFVDHLPAMTHLSVHLGSWCRLGVSPSVIEGLFAETAL
jgi:hypothetical protein